MKKSTFIFATAIIAAIMCVFTGCSDEDSEDSEFSTPNEKVITNLLSTKNPITFRSTGGCRHFSLSEDNKWVEMDYMWVLYAETSTGPKTITFKDGKVYVPLFTHYREAWAERIANAHNNIGYLSYVWDAYVERTHSQDIYVTSDVKYDNKTHVFSFDNTEFMVFSCESDEMVLSGKPFHRIVESYAPTSVVLPDENVDHIFDNCTDAFLFIIECAREEFGKSEILDAEKSSFPDLDEIEKALMEL